MTFRVKHKLDTNHHEIVDGLFAAGYTCQTLAMVGMGTPDLVVAKDKRNFLLELKMPGEKLTPMQVKWIQTWNAPVIVAHSLEEALSKLEAERDRA